MARGNGKPEVVPTRLDAEHELPASDGSEDSRQSEAGSPAGRPEASARDADVQTLRAERDALLDRLARLQAEFENARKRAAREQQDFRDFALVDVVKSLLPVLDNFERALEASSLERTDPKFRGGVELIYKQLSDTLQKLGLRPIAAKGELFDPRLHEAIEVVDTTSARDHEVLEELQRGYQLKDRLVRPAMVKVARNARQ